MLAKALKDLVIEPQVFLAAVKSRSCSSIIHRCCECSLRALTNPSAGISAITAIGGAKIPSVVAGVLGVFLAVQVHPAHVLQNLSALSYEITREASRGAPFC